MNISTILNKTIHEFEFSICTLVTRKQEYKEMLDSFIAKGFDQKTCEYLYIDNSECCTFDAYKGLNLFLQKAKGKYIILCHQDIIIHDDNRTHLVNKIEEIEEADKNWAILANAGGINFKWLGITLTTSSGRVFKEKNLPLLTKTVDENFIVVKNNANLALSNNLSGFHMYGTDLCLIADILGFNAYVIDFKIIHKSDGNADQTFYKSKKELMQKYNHAFRGRFMATTITRFYISGNWLTSRLYNFLPIKFLVRQYYKVFLGKKRYLLKLKH